MALAAAKLSKQRLNGDRMTMSAQAQVGTKFQSKVEFYFLGLTFTILALSIQTAELDSNLISTMIELISWISMLLAGLIGLSRIFWIPTLYNIEDIKENQVNPSSEVHSEAEKQVRRIASKVDGRLPYQRGAFLLGIMLLLIARAIPGVFYIIQYFE